MSKTDVTLEAQKEVKKVHLATLMDICHLKTAELEQKHQKYKGRVVLRGDIVKDCMRGIHRTRIVSFANDCCKSNGCYCEITRMRWTSSRRNIGLHSGQNGGRCKVALNSKVRISFQIYGYVFHDMNDPNLGQTSKTQWFFSNEICTDTHSLDYCGKDSSRKFWWDLDGKQY